MTDWLIFNTGNNASVYLNQDFAERNRIAGDGALRRLGKTRARGVGGGSIAGEHVRLDALTLAGLELRDGVPPSLRTLVAVPTLLSTQAEIEEQRIPVETMQFEFQSVHVALRINRMNQEIDDLRTRVNADPRLGQRLNLLVKELGQLKNQRSAPSS